VPEQSTTPDLAELVRRANDAFNARDVDAWFSFFSPDVVYRPVPTFTDSQERRGLDAMRRFMAEWHDAWADDYTTRAESIREYGGVVVALLRFRGHARASGVEIAGGIFEVCRFRDGKIASVEDFTDRAEALKAAGLEG
jgi:ketosteroid isomerase-like protein